MSNNQGKGGSDVRVADVIGMLEYKILSSEYTDQEYGLYIDVKRYDDEDEVSSNIRLKLRLLRWYNAEEFYEGGY